MPIIAGAVSGDARSKVRVGIGVAIGVVTLFSCTDAFSPAVGPNADVSLFAMYTRRSSDIRPLIDSLERTVQTTQAERAFDVEILDPSQFESHRSMKNLVFAATLDGDARLRALVADIVGAKILGEFESGQRPYAIFSDVFAVGQTIIVIAAPTRDALAERVRTHSAALYDSLEARVRAGLGRLIYLRGENPNVSRYFNRTRPWTVRVPKDYEVEEDPLRDIIIAHTIGPERWLFVQSLPREDGELTADMVIAARRREPRLYADERLMDEDLRWRDATFAGRPAIFVQGRWQSDSYVVGGPLGLYGFFDDDRLYLVDYLVFLPGMEKNAYLRQLDVIAHTFRFRSDR